MPHPVFISYARNASREHALALHQALGGRTAFLDTDAIPLGESFPETLVDALFDAQVVVIFAEPHYFTRWYCLLEFRIARTPFLLAMERSGATTKEDAIRGLVVAMPPRGVDPMMERFPPLVAARNWPQVDDIERIAEFVLAELATNPPTLRERYAADAVTARSFLLAATRLPPPQKIGAIPFVPQIGLANSIGDAFVGRADDLWRIHDLLWTERGNPATAAGLTGAIEATGGFGKTRLALEYLYRFGPRHFKGGLFWINAESDPELQLYDVLQALNPNAPDIAAVRQTPGGVPGAVARAIRSRPDDTPTPLFIIDNVPEPQADQPPKPLDTWCPVLGEVPVLTTSRTQMAIGAGGNAVALPIDTLDPASAVELLTTEIRNDQLDDAEWKHISEWVGQLPLALVVLNRLLRSGEMTPRDLLALSREQAPSAAVDQAMESIRNVVPAGALRGITEAFSASYSLLTPDEQYAARLIAWMAPPPVPTFVIDAFSPEVFAPGVRAKLRNRSFVTEMRDGSSTFFGAMHRVLADFIRAQSDAPEGEAEAVSSVLTQLVASAEGRGTEGSILVRDCAPLTLSIYDNWVAGPSSASGFSRAAAFTNRVGLALQRWGHHAAASNLFESLVSALEPRLGSEHTTTLTAMNNLAITRCARRDYAGAQELQERVLEARRRTHGDDELNTLDAMFNLATTRGMLSDYSGAKEVGERVLEARRRILGDEHPDTLYAINNLANTRSALGDHVGVQELMEGVLEVRRRILGNEHPDTLSAMFNLAATRRDLGDYAGAQELDEYVLEARTRILGSEHPDTLNAMSALALTRNIQGDHAGAEELQDRVLRIMRQRFGDEHPDTLTAMNDLSLTWSALGDHLRAQGLQERVLDARRRGLGPEHPSTTSAGWILLRTYIASNNSDAANHLIRNDLLWLLARDPSSLPHQQRQIQAELRILTVQGNSGQQKGVLHHAVGLLTRAWKWLRE